MGEHKVFVYGTLMANESNHVYLRHGRLLGAATTPPGFRLFSLGDYPVLCPGGRTAVAGEVYAVSRRGLELLDRLEAYPHFYQRRPIQTALGRAWVYYQNTPPLNARLIRSGCWRSHPARLGQRFLKPSPT